MQTLRIIASKASRRADEKIRAEHLFQGEYLEQRWIRLLLFF